MKVVQFTEFGGPEVLQVVQKDIPTIEGNEVLIEVKAIGVNYADTARREGKYVLPTSLPFIPGAEIAGIVVETGEDVKNIPIGTKVAALITSGGYAEYVKVKGSHFIPIPEGLSFEKAVALPLQGLTAYHVLKTMGRLEEGETVLVHAAAGGVGYLAVQLAKIFGAGKVIGTGSNEEKLAFAQKMGADYTVNYTEAGWEKEVKELTNGKGVDVALEMAGGDIFHKTVQCLAPFGRLIIYGVASGEQAKFYPSTLMKYNQSVIGFFLPQIMTKQDLYKRSLLELFEWTEKGEIELNIGGVFPLEEAKYVHEILQGRKTTGKLVLVP